MGKIRTADRFLRCRHCQIVILRGKQAMEQHEAKCSKTGYPLKPGKQKPRSTRKSMATKNRH